MSVSDLTNRVSHTLTSMLGSRKDFIQDTKDWLHLQLKHGTAVVERFKKVCGKTQKQLASLSRPQQVTLIVLAILLLVFLFLDLRQDNGVCYGVVFPCLRPVVLVVYYLLYGIFYVLGQTCRGLAYLLYSIVASVIRGIYKAVVFVLNDLLNVVHVTCSGVMDFVWKVLVSLWSNAVGLLKALLLGGVVVCVAALVNTGFRERVWVLVGPLVNWFQELTSGRNESKMSKDSKKK